LGECQADHDVKDTKSGTSENSFGSSKEPRDVSDTNYYPSKDHYINLRADFLVRLLFKPVMYIIQLVGYMNFMQVMALYIVRQILPAMLTSHAFFSGIVRLRLLGLGSVLVAR